MYISEPNNRETSKETELSLSSESHLDKNDSDHSTNQGFIFVTESSCSQHSLLSSSPFRKESVLMVNRKKSRLMGSQNIETESEDLFSDEDLPEEYKKVKFSSLNVLQLVSLVVIIAALSCSFVFRMLREKRVLGLELWKWEVMIMVMICGTLVSVIFYCENLFCISCMDCGIQCRIPFWLSHVFIAWQCIFGKKVDKMTGGKVLPYVSSIWICLLVGACIWLLKTPLVKVLAMSFHVSTFFDLIQESLFNQYAIETLSGPALVDIDQREHADEEKVMAEATLPVDLKTSVFAKRPIGTPRNILLLLTSTFSRKNIFAWNMKRLMNMVRKNVLSTLDEKFPQSNYEDESAVQITNERRLKLQPRRYLTMFIYLEDLMRFMREDEALKQWALLKRRALALSLNDTKTAVNKLHQMLNALVAIIILVIWLSILRVATMHFLVFLSSQILLVVFIFGNSAKTTFEAIIFLFVMHPFDVSDRVEVDGVHMVVKEMNILTTVFLRYDNQKIIYPNSVLSTKPISYYYCSPHMGDSVDFCIHISTPMEKISMMKVRITRYIENRSDHWYPAPMIVMRDVEDLNGIKWSVWPSHTMNHQEMGERWARRALLVEEMVKIFKELDIQYRMLPLDVNIRNPPPLSSSRAPSNWTVFA
ncbi:unnamed protein product [Withania somnifera]